MVFTPVIRAVFLSFFMVQAWNNINDHERQSRVFVTRYKEFHNSLESRTGFNLH